MNFFFRNFIVISLAGCLIIGLILTISSVLVTIAISNVEKIPFTGNFFENIGLFYKHFIHWWQQWLEKSELIA